MRQNIKEEGNTCPLVVSLLLLLDALGKCLDVVVVMLVLEEEEGCNETGAAVGLVFATDGFGRWAETPELGFIGDDDDDCMMVGILSSRLSNRVLAE